MRSPAVCSSAGVVPPMTDTSAPTRTPPTHWHPARLFYLFLLGFLLGIPGNYLFTLISTGPDSLQPPDQLYVVQLALRYPVLTGIAFVASIGLAILGYVLDQRYSAHLAQAEKIQRDEAIKGQFTPLHDRVSIIENRIERGDTP